MKKNFLQLRGEKGSTLTFIMIGVAGVLVLGAALLALSTTEHFIAGNDIRQLQAHYTAEAGLNAGIAALYNNYMYNEAINGTLDEGSYSVTIEILSGNRRLLTSTGTYGTAQETLQAVIGLNEMYRKSLMVANKLTLDDVVVYGQVHVNDSFHIHDTNFIEDDPQGLPGGFSWATQPPTFENGTLTIVQHNEDGTTSMETYTGSSDEDWLPYQGEYLPLPSVDFDKFAQEAEIVYNGSQTFSSPPPADKVLIQGDLTIDAENFVHEGIIVANGKIQIRGPLNDGLEDAVLTLVASNNISIYTVDKNINIGGRLLLFTNANININGKVDNVFSVRGAMLAQQLDLGDCEVYFDPVVFQDYNQYLPGFGLVVEQWRYPQ